MHLQEQPETRLMVRDEKGGNEYVTTSATEAEIEALMLGDALLPAKSFLEKMLLAITSAHVDVTGAWAAKHHASSSREILQWAIPSTWFEFSVTTALRVLAAFYGISLLLVSGSSLEGEGELIESANSSKLVGKIVGALILLAVVFLHKPVRALADMSVETRRARKEADQAVVEVARAWVGSQLKNQNIDYNSSYNGEVAILIKEMINKIIANYCWGDEVTQRISVAALASILAFMADGCCFASTIRIKMDGDRVVQRRKLQFLQKSPHCGTTNLFRTLSSSDFDVQMDADVNLKDFLYMDFLTSIRSGESSQSAIVNGSLLRYLTQSRYHRFEQEDAITFIIELTRNLLKVQVKYSNDSGNIYDLVKELLVGLSEGDIKQIKEGWSSGDFIAYEAHHHPRVSSGKSAWSSATHSCELASDDASAMALSSLSTSSQSLALSPSKPVPAPTPSTRLLSSSSVDSTSSGTFSSSSSATFNNTRTALPAFYSTPRRHSDRSTSSSRVSSASQISPSFSASATAATTPHPFSSLPPLPSPSSNPISIPGASSSASSSDSSSSPLSRSMAALFAASNQPPTSSVLSLTGSPSSANSSNSAGAALSKGSEAALS